MAKKILLSQGKYAIVDDEDYKWLSEFNWFYLTAGYAIRGICSGKRDNRKVLMHREIMGVSCSKLEVDHKNGDKLDNRKRNLRVCLRSRNMQNRGLTSRNTSGYKGITWMENIKKWRAMIRCNNKVYHIGVYPTPEEAARAYDEKAKELHGKFAWLNFPEGG